MRAMARAAQRVRECESASENKKQKQQQKEARPAQMRFQTDSLAGFCAVDSPSPVRTALRRCASGWLKPTQSVAKRAQRRIRRSSQSRQHQHCAADRQPKVERRVERWSR